jgi:hypothetical protein
MHQQIKSEMEAKAKVGAYAACPSHDVKFADGRRERKKWPGNRTLANESANENGLRLVDFAATRQSRIN